MTLSCPLHFLKKTGCAVILRGKMRHACFESNYLTSLSITIFTYVCQSPVLSDQVLFDVPCVEGYQIYLYEDN